MSTYNKASLVLIPSGTKTGKIYSQKPINGDGDFSFSRSTSATRVNQSGLIEKETQNLLLQSNSFDTTWSTTSTSITSGQSGYDGSNDAWLLDITDGTDSQRLKQFVSLSGVQTFSIYAKAGTEDWIRLRVNTSGTTAQSYFDLANGALGVTQTGLIDRKIEDVGGGWYRCSISFNSTSNLVLIYPALGNGDITHTSGNIYIQDAQLEQGLVARDYIETTTSAVYGGITDNVPRIDYTDATCPSLLLEPTRTNGLNHSEHFDTYNKSNTTISINYGLSPENKNNSAKFIPNTTTTQHSINSQAYGSISSGDKFTFSVFAKADEYANIVLTTGMYHLYGQWVYVSVNLNTGVINGSNADSTFVEDFGNGWYRVGFTATTIASGSSDNLTIKCSNDPSNSGQGPSFAGDGTSGILIYGAQHELGSYPTSYIPTYGTSVSRNIESLSKYDFENSTSQTLFIECGQTKYTGGGGEFIFEKTNPVAAIFRIYIEIDNSGTNVSRIRLRTEYPVNNYDFNLGNKDEFKKIALSINGNTIKLFGNGSLLGTYQVTVVELEQFNWRVQNSTYSTKQLIMFPTVLTDEELEDLTTI